MEFKYAYPVWTNQGLGNRLFAWARAELYCQQTGAVMLEPHWITYLKLGPVIRREHYKRFYGLNFVHGNHIWGLRKWFILTFCKTRVKTFSGMLGLFDDVLAHHESIKDALWKITHPAIRKCVEQYTTPYIGVHIRRGDFCRLGFTTKEDWYLRAIQRAKEAAGEKLDIRVFSDGYPDELQYLIEAFPQDNVIIMDKAPPMRDLWLLARSRVMVATSKSSFSQWAVFLGQMPSVWTPETTCASWKFYANNPKAIIIE